MYVIGVVLGMFPCACIYYTLCQSVQALSPVRVQGETAEERKVRKAAVKEAQRAARAAKKATKGMFKQEASRAKKQGAGRSAAAGATYIIP